MRSIARTWPFLFFSVGIIFGQPNQRLLSAIVQLEDTGNYSWIEKFTLAGLPPPDTISGETAVGGYTCFRLRGIEGVSYRDQTAFKLESIWRRSYDLTDEEVFFLCNSEPIIPVSPKRRARLPRELSAEDIRNYAHPLPHEVLRFLLSLGLEFHENGAIIVGRASISREAFAKYMITGIWSQDASRKSFRSILSRLPPDEVTLTIWLVNEMISEFKIELLLPVNDPRTGQPITAFAYQIELSKVGATNVAVDPKAKLVLGR